MVSLAEYKGQVALLSHQGYFACENQTGLWANRSEVHEWERFKVIRHKDGKVSLKNPYHNKYVVAEGSGGSVAGCNRDKVGDWEKLDLVYNGDGTVSLRAGNGDYFSVQP